MRFHRFFGQCCMHTWNHVTWPPADRGLALGKHTVSRVERAGPKRDDPVSTSCGLGAPALRSVRVDHAETRPGPSTDAAVTSRGEPPYECLAFLGPLITCSASLLGRALGSCSGCAPWTRHRRIGAASHPGPGWIIDPQRGDRWRQAPTECDRPQRRLATNLDAADAPTLKLMIPPTRVRPQSW